MDDNSKYIPPELTEDDDSGAKSGMVVFAFGVVFVVAVALLNAGLYANVLYTRNVA